MVSTTTQDLCDHGSAGAKRPHPSEAGLTTSFFMHKKRGHS